MLLTFLSFAVAFEFREKKIMKFERDQGGTENFECALMKPKLYEI